MKSNSQVEMGLNLNIHRLAFMIDNITNQSLKNNNISLSNSQYLIVKCIYIQGVTSQKEIASYLGVTPAAISRHCKVLENSGIIKISGFRKRAYKIKLTSKGESLFVKAFKLLSKDLEKAIPNHTEISKLIKENLNN